MKSRYTFACVLLVLAIVCALASMVVADNYLDVKHGGGRGGYSHHGGHSGHGGYKHHIEPYSHHHNDRRLCYPPQPYYGQWPYYHYYEQPRSEFYYDGRTWSYRQSW